MPELEDWFKIKGNIRVRKTGTVRLNDNTIVDWKIVLNPEDVRKAIERAVQKMNTVEAHEEALEATIELQIRARAGNPPIDEIMEIGGGIPRIGCGDSWHYESHSIYSGGCPRNCHSQRFITYSQEQFIKARDRYFEIVGHGHFYQE